MADLDPLIRVRKHSIEQKQKFLAELYRQAEEMDRQKKALEDQLREEQESVRNMGAEMLGFFGNYSKAVKERIEEIDESRMRLENRIRMAQDDMRDAFAELKKIEIIQERRRAEEADELARKESDLLDEIGIEGFRRNKSEE